MATLLSELVRILSDTSARELRARADNTPLSRSEMLALATLNELAAACLSGSEVPALPGEGVDWTALAAVTAHDLALVNAARERRSAAS